MNIPRDFCRSGQYTHVKLQLTSLDPRFGNLIEIHERALAKDPERFGEYEEEIDCWIARIDDIPAAIYYSFENHVLHLLTIVADVARN